MGKVEWIALELPAEASDQPEELCVPGQGSEKPDQIIGRETTVTLPLIGVFRGFALDELPLVVLPSVLPGELLTARTTVPLRREDVGAEVVVLCEQGDPHHPIVVGVIATQRRAEDAVPATTIAADNECYVVHAEREIVLRCGDASITLTRAGKIIIKGNYVLSQSTGYNKIKGAAVDIN